MEQPPVHKFMCQIQKGKSCAFPGMSVRNNNIMERSRLADSCAGVIFYANITGEYMTVIKRDSARDFH